MSVVQTLISTAVLSALAGAALSEEIFVETGGGRLAGSLIAPDAASPVAIIVPGSGPTDRDGNNPLGVRASTYRLLAEGLAARGVATLRFDKRGMFASVQGFDDPNDVRMEDYASDVRAWIEALKARRGVSCVWLVGHSEGGIVSLLAGRRAPKDEVCGIALLATPGRKMGAILRAQLAANPANAPLLDQAFAAIEALEQGRKVDAAALDPALQPLFAAPVQDFLIDQMRIDPAELAAGTSQPLLVLQGDRDLQVGEEDARLLAAARGIEPVVLGGVDHLLKEVGETMQERLASYGDPDRPVAPAAIDAVARFIAGR
jgi:uncharacterized protein